MKPGTLRPMLAQQRGWIAAAGFACLAVLVGLPPVARMDLLAYDNIEPLARTSATAPDAVVVAIDEPTLQALGRWPWNRAVHAEVIDRLTAVDVAAIGMSILFPEPAPGDEAFAEALLASGRSILPVAPRQDDALDASVGELLPTPALMQAAGRLGHVDVGIDADGLARRTFARAGSGTPAWDAFALAVLTLAEQGPGAALERRATRPGGGLRLVARQVPWVREGELLLPYPDAGTAPRTISYFSLLETPEAVHALRGKAVFIGTTAGGLAGALASPASADDRPMPAVEFHARAYDALRNGHVYHTATPGLTLGLSLAFLALCAWLMRRPELRGALACGALVLLPPLASGLALRASQVWIPPTAAVLAFLLGYLIWFASFLQRTRGSLEHARHDADATLRSITDAVINIDAHGRITMLNPVAERLMGLGLGDVRKRPVANLLGDFSDDAAQAIEAIAASLRHRQGIRVPEPLHWHSPTGETFALRLTVTPVGNAGEGGVVVLNDVTESLAFTARLRHEATHDLLTGLPNRSLLLDRLQQALANAQRRGTLVALLFVDLDRFKRINDSLGHHAGDQVLREVAERLQASVRGGDTVARWGGDEFIILMDNLRDRSAVIAVAQKTLELLDREVRTHADTGLVVSCSIGISVGPQDSADGHALLSMADKAMYRGKLEGGSRYTFYAPEMNTWSRDRLDLESALRHGLTNREFELFYQPQIDIGSGRLVGLESLIRWHRPGNGLVRPDVFIPAAEESGIICNIGDWAITQAVHQVASWNAEGLSPVPLAVNVSARQCSDMAIVDTISKALADSGLAPHMLRIEVTESTAMRDPERAAELLRSIDALGVDVAVDDFGTGYSSLSLLKRFPISELKIDKSFVGDIAEDNDDAAIVRGTIALAHGLGMRVVAEGVESEAQLDFLSRHGCDVVQGYLFAKPLPADEVRNWLRQLPPHALRMMHNTQTLH